MNKKIILIIGFLVITIGGAFAYYGLIREKTLDFKLEKVFRGDVYQEVVKTGKIIVGEEISLSFKNMGRIKRIDVEVGDIVKLDQFLVELDTTQLFIKLSEAKAALEFAEAELDLFLVGASEEEVRISQAAVDALKRQLVDLKKSTNQRIIQTKAHIASAQVFLQSTEQHLIDIKINAKRELNQTNEMALSILNSTELKVVNTFNAVDSIQRKYFKANNQGGIRVRTNETAIKKAKQEIKFYLKQGNIKTALLKVRQSLELISDSLAIIRETCDVPAYRNIVSDISRTSLDTQRAYIVTALTNVINAQEAIFSAQSTTDKIINTAEGQIASAESTLKITQENLITTKTETTFQLTQIKGQINTTRRQLELKQAKPRQVDIALYQAQIKGAQARKAFLQEQIKENILRSPVEGRVAQAFKRKGETINPAVPVVSLLPITLFQVEVNIYEEDIIKIETGNLVKINLIAFPDKPLKGKIVSINPTEKLIYGVVHYKTTIAFIDELPKRIKPGMTADIIIKPFFREDVLVIDEDAIIKRDGLTFVEVLINNEVQKREIEIGLEGEGDRVEVISGLEQGEQVVIH